MLSRIFEALGWISSGLRWWQERRYHVRAHLTLSWSYPWVWIPGGRSTKRRSVTFEVEASREFEYILAGGVVMAKRPLSLRWTTVGELSDLGSYQLPITIPPNRKKAVKIGGAGLADALRQALGEGDQIRLQIVARDHRDGKLTSPTLEVTLGELEEERII